jgi:predicted RNA-binding Zn ribbon-like protein
MPDQRDETRDIEFAEDGFPMQFEEFLGAFEGFAERFDGFAERFEGFPDRFGDRLCLDFVNTLESPLSRSPVDHLVDVPGVVQWGAYVGVFDAGDVQRIVPAVIEHPEVMHTIGRRTRQLREALRLIFRAIARGEAAAPSDLATLQAEYVQSLQASALVPRDGHYQWRVESAGLEALLAAVTRSAIDVLTTDDLARVKECPGADDCGHLFYDTTRNGRRRWCSMLTCGSRVKMRHLYERQREQRQRAPGAPRPPRPASPPTRPSRPNRSKDG